jgi:hypothetical protein
MRKTIIAGAAVLALAGSTAVYAQHRHGDWQHGDMHHGQSRLSPEDRLAFVDARIAAVKAGLKLTPDQDKLWPAIESAVRDFAKARIDRANASADQQSQQQQPNPVDRLRERADRMTTIGASLKRIADAADPLYKTLDEGQKRRLAFLTHMGGHRSGEGWRERFGRGGDHDFDRNDHGGADHGFHDHGGRDGGDRDGGPERL